MNKAEVIEWIVEGGVIPVIRAGSTDEARRLIDAVYEGGISVVEVTMTVPDASSLIRKLSAENNDLLIGAGSVLDPESARECVEAGAKFIVSPATNFGIIGYCNESETVVIPGALTPTEIINAWDAGADLVKVFPTDSMGGAKYIRSLKKPLPHIRLIPTGGVTLETIVDYLNAGADAVGVGGDLVNLSTIREGRDREITELAREYSQIVSAVRV